MISSAVEMSSSHPILPPVALDSFGHFKEWRQIATTLMSALDNMLMEGHLLPLSPIQMDQLRRRRSSLPTDDRLIKDSKVVHEMPPIQGSPSAIEKRKRDDSGMTAQPVKMLKADQNNGRSLRPRDESLYVNTTGEFHRDDRLLGLNVNVHGRKIKQVKSRSTASHKPHSSSKTELWLYQLLTVPMKQPFHSLPSTPMTENLDAAMRDIEQTIQRPFQGSGNLETDLDMLRSFIDTKGSLWSFALHPSAYTEFPRYGDENVHHWFKDTAERARAWIFGGVSSLISTCCQMLSDSHGVSLLSARPLTNDANLDQLRSKLSRAFSLMAELSELAWISLSSKTFDTSTFSEVPSQSRQQAVEQVLGLITVYLNLSILYFNTIVSHKVRVMELIDSCRSVIQFSAFLILALSAAPRTPTGTPTTASPRSPATPILPGSSSPLVPIELPLNQIENLGRALIEIGLRFMEHIYQQLPTSATDSMSNASPNQNNLLWIALGVHFVEQVIALVGVMTRRVMVPFKSFIDNRALGLSNWNVLFEEEQRMSRIVDAVEHIA